MPKPDSRSNTLDAALADQYFVAGLDTEQRSRLLAASVHRRLEAGAHLFRQGDEANAFYVLLSGRLKLYRLSIDGDEKIMGLVGPGGSFAEGVVFMDNPRYPVNAQMLEPGLAVGLNRDVYLAILRESFSTCLSVMSEVTGRIQGLLDEIESLTLRDSRYRVVHFLVELLPETARRTTRVRLPAPKSTIAARLSIRPETLSRTFKSLSDEGLIEMHDNHVDVPDPARLRRVLAM